MSRPDEPRRGAANTRVQPPRARAARAQATRTQPSRTQPGRTQPGRTQPSRTQPSRTQPARTRAQREPLPRRRPQPAAGRPGPARATRPPRPPARRPPARRRLPLAHPGRRLAWVLAITAVMLSVLGGRLVQLQAFDSRTYALQAEHQRLRNVTLPAARGDIVDRTGAVLATSVDARAVYADPAQVSDPSGTARKLSPLLHVPVATLLGHLTRKDRFEYLAHDLTPAIGRQVSDLDLPGIGVLPERQRVYPGGTLAANVVGAVGGDGKGLTGYEYQLNSLLSGQDGEQTMQVGLAGTTIPAATDTVRAPVPGSSIELTIDRDIQYAAQQAIERQVRRTGAASGSVIVMDPRSGQLLAMATAPTFDPNHVGSANPSTLGNPAVSEVYEPGSVNKVITFAAALQEGVVTPDTPITVPPTYRVAGQVFHDAEVHGTEHLTATGVLAVSSNIGTIQVAQHLGADRLYRYLRAFGFGQPSGIDFPGESDGLLPPPNTWSGTSLPTISFGQGISVTALQVADVYATIANGGERVTPSLVAGVFDPKGHYHAASRPAHHRVVSQQAAHELSDMLEAVTSNEGTAPAARIAGYRVAGKTGTAQRPDGHGGYSGYTASFVGYAPADKPQLLVEVVLQRPVHGHFGGEVAAPVFHDVMSYALADRQVAPTDTKPPVAKLTAR